LLETRIVAHAACYRGFWRAHVGWILVRDYTATRTDPVRDWMKLPELRWLNRYHRLPVFALGAVVYRREVDVSYGLLRLWRALRLVWDVRTPPRSVLQAG
jgi:fatty-acid desaturase